jgi:predicted Zn-dependent protease
MSRKHRLVTSIAITLAVLSSLCSAQSNGGLQNEALEALESHHFHRAVRLLSELVKTEPSAANFAYLAIAENGVKDFAASIADYEQAIKLGDDSVLTRFGLGTTYLEDGKPLAAARQLRLALEREPNYMPARYALGVALLTAKQARQAIPYLESARKSSEGYAQYWVTLVRAEFEAGNDAAAVDAAQRAMASIPSEAELAAALAALCSQHEQYDAARNLFENALELDPNNFKVRLALARVCLGIGDPGESLQVLSKLPPRVGDAEAVVHCDGGGAGAYRKHSICEVSLGGRVPRRPGQSPLFTDFGLARRNARPLPACARGASRHPSCGRDRAASSLSNRRQSLFLAPLCSRRVHVCGARALVAE